MDAEQFDLHPDLVTTEAGTTIATVPQDIRRISDWWEQPAEIGTGVLVRQPIFQKFSGPNVGPILDIHWRNGQPHDGMVTFHRKPPDAPKRLDGLFAIPCGDLRDYFPQFIELLEEDAYFSINAFKFPRSRRDAAGTWKPVRSRYSPDGLDLAYPNRKKKMLRWLTANFADLDCYQLGVSTGQAIGAILDAQDAGTIPPPSMLVRSGQGVWVFWFLIGDDDDRSLVPAFPEKVDAWYHVQRRLGDLFATCGAYSDARDACRVTRVPGSINRTCGVRTEFALLFDADGRRRLYRLGEIAAWLGVQERRRLIAQPDHDPDPERQQRGRSGWQGRWQNYYSDFRRLWSMRGGFRPGMRNKAVCLLVTILRTISRFDPAVTDADIADEVRSLFGTLDQPADNPYTEDELQTALVETQAARSSEAKTPGKKRIAHLLDITPEEAAELTSWTLPAPRFRDLDAEAAKPLTRTERAARRQATLKAKLDELRQQGYRVPHLKRLADWLNEQGHDCTFRTVKSDLEVIGVPNPRSHRRRRKHDDPDADRLLLPPTPE